MEFEIKNLGLTIAVGGLVFGGVYMTLLLLNIRRPDIIPSPADPVPKFLVSAVGLAIVFGFGVLLEGVTQNITAGHGDNGDIPIIEPSFAALVDSDKSLRHRGFFTITNFSAGGPCQPATNRLYGLKYQPLASDVMQAATNDSLIWSYVSPLQKTLESYPVTNGYFLIVGQKKYDDSVDSVNNIFYKAKNLVYREDNYFSELGAIEIRKNFMLALLFDFLLLSSAHLLLGFYCLVRNSLGYVVEKGLANDIQCPAVKFLKLGWLASGRMLRSCFTLNEKKFLYYSAFLAYGAMFYCALLAYRVESQSYNSRIFGYCATLLVHESDIAGSSPKPHTPRGVTAGKPEPD